MTVFRNPYTGATMHVPFDAPTLVPPPSPTGTWLLVEKTHHHWDVRAERMVARSVLAYVRDGASLMPLHPLEAADPRVADLLGGKRVHLPAPTFHFWQPRRAGLHLAGLVATSLSGGSPWKTGLPSLWVDGEPHAFLQRTSESVYDWVRRGAGTPRQDVWFTTDGTSLWRLLAVGRHERGYLDFTIARVV